MSVSIVRFKSSDNKDGEIIGDGLLQISALLRELEKRPTKIHIMCDANLDREFNIPLNHVYIEPSVIYSINIEHNGGNLKFESVRKI